MEKVIDLIDSISAWFGKAFAWCILIMTFGVGYEVFVRYVLRDPTSWAFDLSYMMYGTLFMMAGAYTLSRNGHVRGDFLYRLWKPRIQGAVEFVLYFIFFFPGVIALIYAGSNYAARSVATYRRAGENQGWNLRDPSQWEVSVFSPAGVPVFQFKMIIVAAGTLLLIQGIAQVLRCVIAMRDNEWPAYKEDVEELEDILLKKGAEGAFSEDFLKNNPEIKGGGKS
ncbi:MAG: TRAP transporter small permease subunit [Pseudomonadota bacterium]